MLGDGRSAIVGGLNTGEKLKASDLCVVAASREAC